MPLLKQTPLAWKNLTHDWRRLVVAVAGIGFAVLLMFTQVGFQNALFDSQVKIIDDLRGDVFIASRARYTLAAEKRFPLTILNQAASCPGVAGAYPLYAELSLSRLKNLSPDSSRKAFPIRSLGFRLQDPLFKSAEVNRQTLRLRVQGTALIDDRSKAENFPFPMNDETALARCPAELADRKIQIVGVFDMGTDFAHDGNLLMSAESFAEYYPQRAGMADPLSVVDVGVLEVSPGVDVETVRRTIDQVLDDRVVVASREEFRNQEIRFWDESTPIGIVFTAGKIIGFVVGMVICYQVIYSDIADHLPEFATLKAMGYSTAYFLRMIVAESVLLAFIGFVPGLVVSAGLYSVLAKSTGLLLRMNAPSATLVLALTIAMCIASGLLAVRKLLSADPANLF